MSPNDQRVNLDLLQWIAADALVILEIGCGYGELGAKYKPKNPHCHYIAVEKNPDKAVIAQQKLDKVIIGDIAELDLSRLGIKSNSVDCLIYDHLLEELLKPEEILQDHVTNILKDQGLVLASINNVGHWSNIINLIKGKWDHNNSKHLSFFTLEAIKNIFTQAELKIDQIIPHRNTQGEEFPLFKGYME